MLRSLRGFASLSKYDQSVSMRGVPHIYTLRSMGRQRRENVLVMERVLGLVMDVPV